MNVKTYEKAAKSLIWEAVELVGVIATQIPQRTTRGSKFARAGGTHWDNLPMRVVSYKIADVCYRFDQLQHELGLSDPRASRFGNPPTGSTNPINQENSPMAKTKASPGSPNPTPK